MKSKGRRQMCPKCNSVMKIVPTNGANAMWDCEIYICECGYQITRSDTATSFCIRKEGYEKMSNTYIMPHDKDWYWHTLENIKNRLKTDPRLSDKESIMHVTEECEVLDFVIGLVKELVIMPTKQKRL